MLDQAATTGGNLDAFAYALRNTLAARTGGHDSAGRLRAGTHLQGLVERGIAEAVQACAPQHVALLPEPGAAEDDEALATPPAAD